MKEIEDKLLILYRKRDNIEFTLVNNLRYITDDESIKKSIYNLTELRGSIKELEGFLDDKNLNKIRSLSGFKF